MEIVRTKMLEPADENPVAVAAGFFDGCHIGHRAVLKAALDGARADGARAWVLTFSDHPRGAIPHGSPPPLLSTTEQRLAFFDSMGFDGVCLIGFDAEIAALSPADFAKRLRILFPALRCVCTGKNWRFGKDATGTPGLLAAFGKESGFKACAIPVAMLDGEPISSTRIRAAVASGDLADAAAMLGRDFSVSGKVVRGRQVGSANGVATANIVLDGTVTPPVGVYAVEAEIDGICAGGVADLGWRPTFPDARPDTPILEAHFFSVSRELYGETLEVRFLKRLRDEMAFSSKEALFRQIALDMEAARAALKRR